MAGITDGEVEVGVQVQLSIACAVVHSLVDHLHHRISHLSYKGISMMWQTCALTSIAVHFCPAVIVWLPAVVCSVKEHKTMVFKAANLLQQLLLNLVHIQNHASGTAFSSLLASRILYSLAVVFVQNMGDRN